MIEKGKCANWGQLPDFTQKTDRFGLGFTAEAQRAVRKERIRKAPVFITNPRVNAIEEDIEEAEFDSWIYPTTNHGPSVVPQNLPSHILQNLQRTCFKISPRVAQFKGILTVKK